MSIGYRTGISQNLRPRTCRKVPNPVSCAALGSSTVALLPCAEKIFAVWVEVCAKVCERKFLKQWVLGTWELPKTRVLETPICRNHGRVVGIPLISYEGNFVKPFPPFPPCRTSEPLSLPRATGVGHEPQAGPHPRKLVPYRTEKLSFKNSGRINTENYKIPPACNSCVTLPSPKP